MFALRMLSRLGGLFGYVVSMKILVIIGFIAAAFTGTFSAGVVLTYKWVNAAQIKLENQALKEALARREAVIRDYAVNYSNDQKALDAYDQKQEEVINALDNSGDVVLSKSDVERLRKLWD